MKITLLHTAIWVTQVEFVNKKWSPVSIVPAKSRSARSVTQSSKWVVRLCCCATTHLLRLSHARHHHRADLGQHGRIERAARWLRGHADPEDQRCGHERRLVVELGCEQVPVFERDLEHLHVLHLRDAHEDAVRLEEDCVQLLLLHEGQVVLEEREEEEREVVDEVLIALWAPFVCICDVWRGRGNGLDEGKGMEKEGKGG